MANKSAVLHVRLTPEIAKKLSDFSKKIGKNSSEFIRDYIEKTVSDYAVEPMPNPEDDGKNLSGILNIRLTVNEAEAFASHARKLGETRSRLLRKLVRELINHPYPDLLTDEQSLVRITVRYLAGISRNLNQITAAIHAGKLENRTINEAYLNKVKEHVNEVKLEFLNYLEVTKKRLIFYKDV